MAKLNVFLGLLFCSAFFFSSSFSQNIVQVDIDPTSLAQHQVSAYRQTENNVTTVIGSYLVVRRGFAFNFLVQFDNSAPNIDALTVDTDTKDLPIKKTQATQVSDKEWRVEVNTPNVAPIGNYTLIFTFGTPYRYQTPLIVIFNPYNPEDSTYFPQQDQLNEYIQSEYGYQYRGSQDYHYPSRWYFAQFSPYSIGTAMFALKNFNGDRSDPIAVSRFFSLFMTIQPGNPNGLVQGRWQTPYSGGKEPTYWSGTNQIVQQYVTTGFRTVKYAQCWVFGGCLNTMMRTIGIASRQLFTYASGHESPVNGVYHHLIEEKYDQNGKYLGAAHGSVWNFHSWNDIWLNSRKDNAPNGWQALDGTPQEESDGMYQMGPGALSAIKTRQESFNYDIPFVVSEVDATLVRNMYNCSSWGSCTFMKNIQNTTTGALIVTSDIAGTSTEQDLTYDYKPKGNDTSFLVNSLTLQKKNLMRNIPSFELGVSLPEVEFGSPITCVAKAFCLTCRKDVKVDIFVDVVQVSSMGKLISRVKSLQKTVVLSEKKHFAAVEEFALSTKDYRQLNLKDSSLKFQVSIVYLESLQKLESKIATILPPPISIYISRNGQIMAFQNGFDRDVKIRLASLSKVSVMFHFDNSPSLGLKDVQFQVNTGILGNTFDTVTKLIKNGSETYVGTFQLLGDSKGMRRTHASIIITMVSDAVHSQSHLDIIL